VKLITTVVATFLSTQGKNSCKKKGCLVIRCIQY